MDTGLDEQIRALDDRRAFVRRRAWTVRVWGADAATWLGDLVTAGIEDLLDGGSVRSLILSPTGRIRAEFHVLRAGPAFLLAQTSDQPEPIDAILAPYVLSSAVELERSDRAPVLVPADDGWSAVDEPPDGHLEAGADAAEAWRIRRGIARFPVDLDPDSLPAEAGLDAPPVTDTGKGCFLGQEAVARVRNLGHPTRLVRGFDADAGVDAGETLRVDGADVGVVTSVAPGRTGGMALLARLRWDSRDKPVRTASGATLRPR
jgi:folate-binding protein YgfZ